MKDLNLQKALDARLSGLKEDPWLVNRILLGGKSVKRGRKALTACVLTLVLVMALAVGAMAGAILSGHDLALYKRVKWEDLIPEQYEQYDVCHYVGDGYVLGGFSIDGDTIGPMSREDALICLNEHFQMKWTLTDERLTGCLYDCIRATDDALYFGMERDDPWKGWTASLAKISRGGELLWQTSGPEGFHCENFIANENGVYAAGSLRNPSNGEDSAALIGLDSQGQLRLCKTMDQLPAFQAICAAQDEMVLASAGEGGVTLIKMNAEGEETARQTLKAAEHINTLQMKERGDGTLLLSMAIAPSDPMGVQEGITSLKRYFVIDSETLMER